jgi:hypothetical protein
VAEILTKSQFAALLAVNPAAVSNWIRRQRLTPPAVRADGKIDVDLARAQLGRTLDAGQRAIRQPGADHGAPATGGADWSPSAQASTQLLRARALSASVAAERSRRELMAERSKYMLTAEAEAAWARVLSDIMLQVEQSFADLAIVLQQAGSVREKEIALRRWWRNQRLRGAEQHRIAAAAQPQFVEDAIG